MPQQYTEEQRIKRRAYTRAWLAARPNYRKTLHSEEERREINNRRNAKTAEYRRNFYLRRRQINRDEILEKERVYRATKASKLHDYFKNYRERNRASLLTYNRAYKVANRKHLRERYLIWYARNYERITKQTTEWDKRWRKANPHKVKQRQHRHRVARRNAAVEDCSEKIKVLLRAAHCHWCTAVLSDKNREIDHVVPISRGGLHCNDNLVAACRQCNRSKGAKLISEWVWKEAA